MIFFQEDNGKFYPHLKVLHTYPTLLPIVQVDMGAIKFILQGADIMAPGLISEGGNLPSDLKQNDIVVCIIIKFRLLRRKEKKPSFLLEE